MPKKLVLHVQKYFFSAHQIKIMDKHLVTTGFEFQGYRITKYLGVSKGIIVRSRSIIGNIGAGFQSLFGGNITIYTELCEKAREDAYNLLIEHAEASGANAIIGMRYDANDVMNGITEVLAYGTAVVVEKQ
jgi:uncharacterized protein YbjQ (UPF0145 family)